MMRIRNFREDQHGGVAILIGFAIVMLIISIAVGIETGRAFLLRNKAVNALDGAVIAAAAIATEDANITDLNTRATEFFKANFPANYLGSEITQNVNIIYDEDTKKISSDLSLRLPLYFGGFLPIDNMNIKIFSETSRVVRNVEIALVMDHTASLCDPTCDPAINIRSAVQTLFETLESFPSPKTGDIHAPHYSYIPFNHSVKVNDDFYYSVVDPANYGPAEATLPNVMGLTANTDELLARMDSLPVDEDDTPGGTNTSIGTWWGWKTLRPTDKGDFEDESAHEIGDSVGSPKHEDEHPLPFPYQTGYNPNDPTFKFMIILTDGRNEYFYNGKGYADLVADQDQATFCTQIKAEGISIFTIPYGIEGTAAERAKVINIMRTCASDPKPNFFYNAPTGTDLAAVFKRIADTISSLVITQ